MEAGVVDCGAVAAEHGDGVRGRAAAGPFEACHLVLRLSFGGRGGDLGRAVSDDRGEARRRLGGPGEGSARDGRRPGKAQRRRGG